MLLPQFYVDDIIKTALQEDINYLDTTTDLMIPATARSTARFMARKVAWRMFISSISWALAHPIP